MQGAVGFDKTPTPTDARGVWNVRDVNDARISDAWPFVPPPAVRLMREVVENDGATSHWEFDDAGPDMVVADDFTSDTRSNYQTLSTRAASGWSMGSWSYDDVNDWVEIRTGNNVDFVIAQDVGVPDSGYARVEFIKRADYPNDNGHGLKIFTADGDHYSFSWAGSNYSQGVHRSVDDTIVEEDKTTSGTVNSDGVPFVVECYWSPTNLRLVIDGVEEHNLDLTGSLASFVRWELDTSQTDIDLSLLIIGAGEPVQSVEDAIDVNDLDHQSYTPSFAESLLALETGGRSFSGPQALAPVFDDRTTNLTLELWLEWDGEPTKSSPVYNGDSSSTGYGFRIGDGSSGAGGILALFHGGNLWNAFDGGGYALPAGEIVHVVLTRDSSTWRLFIDTVEVDTSTENPNAIDIINDNFRVDGNDHVKVDAVSFYPFVLGSAEIQAHYDVGAGNWQPPLRWKPPRFQEYVIDDSPSQYFTLDDDTVADEMGGVAGTNNGATFDVPGALSSLGEKGLTGAGFDGASHISLPSPSGLETAFAHELWFKTTSVSLDETARQYLITLQQNPPTVGDYTYIQRQGMMIAGNRLEAQVWKGDASSPVSLRGSEILEAGRWHHAVLTGDADGCRLYLNARLVAESLDAPASAAVNELLLGRRGDAQGDDYFTGDMDEVAIYNHALSSERILEHYRAGTADLEFSDFTAYRDKVIAMGPISYYRMDETGVVPDQMSNHPLTMEGDAARTGGAISLDPAMHFDGVDDRGFVDASYTGILGTASRSLIFWVRRDDASGLLDSTYAVLNMGPQNINGARWTARVDVGDSPSSDGVYGCPRLDVYGGNIVWDKVVTDGEWHMIAIVFPDGATDVDEHLCWVDGVPIGATTKVTPQVIDTQSSQVTIGYDYSGGSEYWDADLDEIALFEREVTSDEVMDLAALIFDFEAHEREVLSDSPVAFWMLQEVSGGTASDRMETSDGSLSSVTLDLEGPVRGVRSMGLDGATSYIAIANHLLINHDPNYTTAEYDYPAKTVELWFMADRVTGAQVIYNQGGSTNGVAIYLDGSTLRGRFWAEGNNWSNDLDMAFEGIQTGVWYHVVLTGEFETTKQADLYVDGALVDSDTKTDAGWLAKHSGGIAIGCNDDSIDYHDGTKITGPEAFFQGRVAYVANFNKHLTAARAMAHYAGA